MVYHIVVHNQMIWIKHSDGRTESVVEAAASHVRRHAEVRILALVAKIQEGEREAGVVLGRVTLLASVLELNVGNVGIAYRKEIFNFVNKQFLPELFGG